MAESEAGEYFSWLRQDMLIHVPHGAKRVLSVGCGAGVTEAELVKAGVEVVGIELDPQAALVARRRGLTVFVGDVMKVTDDIGGEFDCLLYGDVLEHLPDPLAVLDRHCALLRPGGRAIISVPNFRHYEVLWQLVVKGHIRYEDSGILDRTHLRITTRKMALEWVHRLGLVLISAKHGMSRRREKLIAACSLGLLLEFVGRRVIVVAEKPA